MPKACGCACPQTAAGFPIGLSSVQKTFCFPAMPPSVLRAPNPLRRRRHRCAFLEMLQPKPGIFLFGRLGECSEGLTDRRL